MLSSDLVGSIHMDIHPLIHLFVYLAKGKSVVVDIVVRHLRPYAALFSVCFASSEISELMRPAIKRIARMIYKWHSTKLSWERIITAFKPKERDKSILSINLP